MVNDLTRWIARNRELVSGITRLGYSFLGLNVGISALRFIGIWTSLNALRVAAGFLAIGRAVRSLGLLMLLPLGRLRALGTAMLGMFAAGGAAGALSSMRAGFVALGAGILRALNPLRMFRGIMAGFAIGGPIALGIAAIGGSALFVYSNWEGIKKGAQSFWESMKEGMGPDVVNAISPLTNAFGNLYTWISGIPDKLKLSDERWKEIGETLGGGLGVAIVWVVKQIEGIGEAFETAANIAVNAVDRISKAISSTSGQVGAWYGAGGKSGPASVGGAPSLPGKAAGGPVTAGKRYLVGERGPELFEPSSSGRIVPNGAGAVGVTVHQNITINSATDLAATCREVTEALRESVNEAFRGTQSDVGLRWA